MLLINALKHKGSMWHSDLLTYHDAFLYFHKAFVLFSWRALSDGLGILLGLFVKTAL